MQHFDAVVLGSGVGGSCTAALLAKAGLRILLVEKRRDLGGRFSTVDHQGYLCATGGLAVQCDGPIEEVCQEIGVESGVRPAERSAFWVAGEYHEISPGGGSLRSTVEKLADSEEEACRVLDALSDALQRLEPSDCISFRDWLGQYTGNEKIHGIFQSVISSLLTVNASELPAAEYFRFIKTVAPLRFGYIEGGSLRLWERMAEFIRGRGGEVRTSCGATAIVVDQGRVQGVTCRKGRQEIAVRAPVVVSNLGPGRTVELAGAPNFERSYLAQLEATLKPTAILWLHLASDELLLDYSAIAVCGARRVNMVDVPSLECPDVAPPGKHLYTVGAAPRDTLHPADLEGEMALVLEDLRDIVPDFEAKCRVLTKTCYRGKWPGFRTRPGSPLPRRTPVRGLYNVGDACCPRGYAGSMGAAHSAQLVRDDILSG
jgi:phytoene dehydrogenase-like protein